MDFGAHGKVNLTAAHNETLPKIKHQTDLLLQLVLCNIMQPPCVSLMLLNGFDEKCWVGARTATLLPTQILC